MKQRVFLALLALLTMVVVTILVRHSRQSEVNLGSVHELAGELLEDVDAAGQRLARISEGEETALGGEIAKHIASCERFSNHHEQARYVKEVGRSLASCVERRAIPYQFHVIDAPWANAFAIPGGHVYISTGLLKLMETEGELAYVLAHEIGHIDLRHCIELFQYERLARKIGGDLAAAVASIGYSVYRQAYSQRKETAADTSAFHIGTAVAYDPGQIIQLLERFARIEAEPPAGKAGSPQQEIVQVARKAVADYLRSHPSALQRITQTQRLIREADLANGSRRFYVGRENFRRLTPHTREDFPTEWVRVK